MFLSLKALVFRTRRYESEESLSVDGLMGFESITEQQVKYLISWRSVNCWFLLIQSVLSCVGSVVVFPKCYSRLRKASSLEFFLWFLQTQVSAFLVDVIGREWRLFAIRFFGPWHLCVAFNQLQKWARVGLFLLVLQSAVQQSLGDLKLSIFPVLLCKNGWIWCKREKREAVLCCEGG